MKYSSFSAVLFAVVLSGCADIQVSPDAAPGKNLIPPSFAGNFFTEICLTTAPDFEGVPQAIAGEPFVQHSETGTYFHQFADLSIKASERGCSLVFRSEMSIDETLSELANGTVKNAANWGVTIPRNIDVISYPDPDGNGRYFRIGLPR